MTELLLKRPLLSISFLLFRVSILGCLRLKDAVDAVKLEIPEG